MTTKEPSWLSEELMKKASRYARKVCTAKMDFSDIDDVKQDLLYGLCKSMKRYDSTRGSQEAFLEEALRRLTKMHIRAFFMKKNGKDVHFEPLNDDNHGTVDNEWANDITDRIDLSKASNRLSRVQFQMYTLLKDYTVADVAKLLELPYSSMYLKMRKIHEKMRRAMESSALVIKRGMNMNDLSQLETLTAKEVSALSAADLMDLNEQVTKLSEDLKNMKEKLDDGMNLKFRNSVIKGLQKAGKDTGTLRFFNGEVMVVAEVPKKVTWDMQKMGELVKLIPSNRKKDIVKISYAIDERKYSALPREYQEVLKDARTVTPGKIRYQFSIGEDIWK